MKPETIAGRSRRAVAGGQRRRARPARHGSRAATSSGKTGTAQVISNEGAGRASGKTDKDLRDHGWFVFMVPQRQSGDRRRGVASSTASHGGVSAAPIAQHVIDTYFAQARRPAAAGSADQLGDTVGPAAAREVRVAAAAGPGGTR